LNTLHLLFLSNFLSDAKTRPFAMIIKGWEGRFNTRQAIVSPRRQANTATIKYMYIESATDQKERTDRQFVQRSRTGTRHRLGGRGQDLRIGFTNTATGLFH